jgi:hypothetical protein
MKYLSRPLHLFIVVMATCALSLSSRVTATTLVMPTDAELAVKARLILTARVLSLECAYDESKGMVFTYVRLSVTELLKGRLSSDEIVLREFGGETADHGTLIFGAPTFYKGEDVLLYLNTWQDGSLHVHDMAIGKFAIEREQGTGIALVRRPTTGAGVTIEKRAGRSVIERMELAGFIGEIRKTLLSQQARVRQLAEQYDREAPIREWPPEYHSKVGGKAFRPQFTIWGYPFQRWFEPDDGQSIALAVNPDRAPSDHILEDMTLAANAWSSVPSTSVRVTITGTTDTCNQAGGLSTIVFNNCDGYFNGLSDLLALAGIPDYNRTETKRVNGTHYSRAKRGHVSFNPFYHFSTRCLIQATAAHEIGHVIGLDHSYGPGYSDPPTPEQLDALMYYLVNDSRCASLRTDDINGISFIYPAGGINNGGPIITTETLPQAKYGVAYQHLVEATGGTPPYQFSLAVGYPMPGGLSISRKGVVSGTPNRTGSYVFALQVSDAVGRVSMARYVMELYEGAYASHFINQIVPRRVEPGEYFQINLHWANTGSVTWSGEINCAIASQNPPDNTIWGVSRQPLSISIISGNELEMGFHVTAPARPGLYPMQWQLRQEQEGFFGEPSTDVLVRVDDGVTPIVTGAKYKSAKGKLTVSGERFAEGITLIIDGRPASFAIADSSTLVAKRQTLAPGTHEVYVVSTSGVESAAYVFTVN